MKYQIQQLIYELIVFWHGQENGDWSKVWDMVHNSLKITFFQDDFYFDHDTSESIERYNRFLKKHNFIGIYHAIKKILYEGRK